MEFMPKKSSRSQWRLTPTLHHYENYYMSGSLQSEEQSLHLSQLPKNGNRTRRRVSGHALQEVQQKCADTSGHSRCVWKHTYLRQANSPLCESWRSHHRTKFSKWVSECRNSWPPSSIQKYLLEYREDGSFQYSTEERHEYLRDFLDRLKVDK